MPRKLNFLEGVKMAAGAAGILGIMGAGVVGGVAALVAGFAITPAVVTAAVCGASIFGVGGTLLAGFACGMADDSSFGSILLGGLGTTVALAAGFHALKPGEPPAPKTSAFDTHITAPFNEESTRMAAAQAALIKRPVPAMQLAA
jgi:hypothetical protein